ncbi:MAG TPA: fused MFS/spermidine synthase, partial [Polyangiales bacterium]
MADRLRRVAFVAFFLSGASSLVFQTLWSRLLSHVFGSSSVAISSVVSVFMAGLGLGAWLFGRRADKIRDPLRLYALAEFGVGCAALVVPWLVRSDGVLATINAALRNSLGAESALFMLVRFLCIVPVLLVPTVLMGSTLPLLARHFVSQHTSPGRASVEVGRLYAVNTCGAIVGVLMGSFVLLPRCGVHLANTVAACTNFCLALVVLALRARSTSTAASGPANASQPPPPDEPAAPHFPLRLRRAAALAFACSGFASLLYEIVWSRALVNTIGGSLYSFALILTTFLIGIALGSAAGSSLCGVGPALLLPTSAAAALLCCIASGPILAHFGVWAALWSAAGSCTLLALWFASARGKARQIELFDAAAQQREERKAALLALAVPFVLVVVGYAAHPDRLARVTTAVVVTSCVFVALLLTLGRRPMWLLTALQLFIAGATLTSDFFADELSLTFASMVAPLYDRLPEHVSTVQALMCATAALCVLPSALGMGAVFPITLRVWSAGGAHIGQDVGKVYAGNTLGSIVGAWLPGFLLMPALGMQTTLHIGIATNLLIAFGLALSVAWAARDADAGAWADTAPSTERRTLWLVAAVVPWLVAALAFVTLRPPEALAWNISKMTLGAFRISLARDVLDEESWGAPDLVYYHDGLSTTVTVERWGRHFSLKNNGKVDASNGDDMPTQIMVAALPMLMHRDGPKDLDVAIVGFGSGVTVGAALQFPLRSVQVVELERSIVEASRFFADVNHLDYAIPRFPYVRTPRLTIINDDGRNYLAATPRRFDVIVSEPSNPWLTGVSDLFTIDHFRISKRKLKPGGIYCQWAQLYEISPQNVRTIYRTFASQFRHVVVFSAEDLSSDTVLVGSDEPLPLDLGRLRRAFAFPGVASELERAYIHSPFDVFARVLLADKSEV